MRILVFRRVPIRIPRTAEDYRLPLRIRKWYSPISKTALTQVRPVGADDLQEPTEKGPPA
jgi:hypothetical protein